MWRKNRKTNDKPLLRTCRTNLFHTSGDCLCHSHSDEGLSGWTQPAENAEDVVGTESQSMGISAACANFDCGPVCPADSLLIGGQRFTLVSESSSEEW